MDVNVDMEANVDMDVNVDMEANVKRKTRLCTFCEKKGILPPHNHTLKDFSKKNTPIICPELLNCICTYCKCKGHTKNYCSILKQKEIDKSTKNDINKIKSNFNKRIGEYLDRNDEELEYKNSKVSRVSIFTAEFGAMNMDT